MKLVMCMVMAGAYFFAHAEDAVFRIHATRQVADFASAKVGDITSRIDHGIATAVDLAEFGIPGKGYAITPAHVVLGADIVQDDGDATFSIIAMDKELDVALIHSRNCVLSGIRLSQKKVSPAEAKFRGSVANEDIYSAVALYKESKGIHWYYGAERFCLGSSGSAILDKNELLAMGVSCESFINSNGKVTPIEGACVALPARRIRQFIREYMEK